MREPSIDPLLAGALARVVARLEAPDGVPTGRHTGGHADGHTYDNVCDCGRGHACDHCGGHGSDHGGGHGSGHVGGHVGGHTDERTAAVLRLCRAALGERPRPVPYGEPPTASPTTPPPVPARWTRLPGLLRDDPATALGLAERIAETTAFGAVQPAEPVRKVWDLAVAALLAVAVQRADPAVLAPLIRAGLFLRDGRTPYRDGASERDGRSATAAALRAARFLAAWQRPDGGFGTPPVTVDCAWALAEAAAPGITAAQRALAVPGPAERPRTLHSSPATYGAKE